MCSLQPVTKKLCSAYASATRLRMKALIRMNSVYVLRGFEMIKIYGDKTFEPCQSELAKMKIELVYCDKGAHVHFADRLIMELVYATNVMVNSIRRDEGVHHVMSHQQIVMGR